MDQRIVVTLKDDLTPAELSRSTARFVASLSAAV